MRGGVHGSVLWAPLQPPLVRMVSSPLQYTLFFSRFNPPVDLALVHVRPCGKVLSGSLDLDGLEESDAHADHVPALFALEPRWLLRFFHIAVHGSCSDHSILASLLIDIR
jgi:hypothetical protein